MNKDDLIKATAKWLSDGAGLPLEFKESYTPARGVEVTKEEAALGEDGPHALLLIGNVQDFPKLNVPLFVFGYEGGQPKLTGQEEDESYIVNGLADNPSEAVKNALDFLRFEFSKPAKKEKPKFLVIAEYPLLAALALGKLGWLDFYFRQRLVDPQTEKEKDLLISAYVNAVALSRNNGLKLDPYHLLERPSLINMIPLIKEYCGYLQPEIIKRAGITSLMLNQEIEQRKAFLSLDE